MTFTEEKLGGVIVLRFSGKINTETSEDLLKEMNGPIDNGARHLLLDLSCVDYINSSGLRILLTVAKKMTDLSGKIVLADATELIYQVLQVSGCTSHIGVYATREDELKALNA
jgi:anti-sigma B factor antagonist